MVHARVRSMENAGLISFHFREKLVILNIIHKRLVLKASFLDLNLPMNQFAHDVVYFLHADLVYLVDQAFHKISERFANSLKLGITCKSDDQARSSLESLTLKLRRS